MRETKMIPKYFIKKRYGFSMIEMMVVLALIGIILGISIPAVANISRTRAGSDLGKFNAYLKKMFMKSIRKNEYIRIVVDLKSGTYWAEKTDTPFFLTSGEVIEEQQQRKNQLLEDFESKQKEIDMFEGKGGAANLANDFMSKMMMQNSEDEESMEDFYHWENFVPERKNLKQLLKPDFETVSEKHKIDSGLQWTAFFSYHTPEILQNESDGEEYDDERKDMQVSIYIFPQGRIEPFYLSIGEKQGETLFYISSDFFLNTKIVRGRLDEDVINVDKMRQIFDDKDEEGKS